jgi:acetylornithine deacetylase
MQSSSPLLEIAALTETLAALVAIDSVNPSYGGPAGGERRVLEWVGGWLAARGIASRMEDALPGRPNLRAAIPGLAAGPPLMLQTHVDTVSVAGMRIDPFAARIEGGRLWGRGSTDAKGQAVAMLHAIAAWAAASDPPPRAIELALVSDEEFGFGGARDLVRRGLSVAGIVIGEPTGLRVVTSHKGVVRFEVVARGRLAHAARPARGVNAIAGMAALLDAIHRDVFPALAARRAPLLDPPTLNIATIAGGRQANQVPDECRVLLERRMLPGETAAQARAEIEALFPAIQARFPGLGLALEPTTLDNAAVEAPADSPLAAAAGIAAAALGRPAEPIGVDYATDASALSAAGAPMIIAGPGSIDQAHTEDEFIELDELAAGARFYADLIGRADWA